MAMRTLEEVFAEYASVALQEEGVEVRGVDQLVVATSEETGPLWRRCEARSVYQRLCSYEVLDATGGESLAIEQGEAFALNLSAEGILFFVGRAFHEKQLIEVHTSRSRWGRAANIYEVRWTKPVHLESGGALYLVGGQRIFGLCDYVSF